MAKASKSPVNADASAPLQNAKHEEVARLYMADREKIGWKVYKRVYPKSSQRACETSFSDLLKKPEFAARVEWLARQAADTTVMSAREVLQELSKLGRSSIKNCLVQGDDTSDVVTDLRDMNDEHAACIQELTVESYVEGQGENKRDVKRVKVKLHDKRGPLQDLARHHKLLGGDVAIGGDVHVTIKRYGRQKGAGEKASAA